MLKIVLGSILVVSLSPILVSAAVNPQTSVADILSLPEQNRKEVLKERGPQLFLKMVALAGSNETPMNLRWKTILALPEVDMQKAIPELVKISKSSVWHARNASLVALHSVRSEQTQAVAENLLSDPALVVRSAAVDVLKSYPQASVRLRLWEALNDPKNFRKAQSLWIRRQIMEVLAVYPKVHEQEQFVNLKTDRDLGVRQYAELALKSY